MVDDRQVEPYGGLRADLGRRILGRQDAPLHRGELGMLGEKALDLVEVVRRGDEVVVKAYDYVALAWRMATFWIRHLPGRGSCRCFSGGAVAGSIDGAGVPFSARRISREASARGAG